MFVKNVPFIIPMKRQATSANTFTAKTVPWRTDDVVIIDSIAVSVDAHQPKTVHIGVIRDENVIYLETLVLNVNGNFFCTYAPIRIPSGYRVVVRCVTPTTGVYYTINVFGHLEVECKE